MTRGDALKPTGFYKLSQDYFDIIKQIGGTYRDSKERPIYCCLQDKKHSDIYWAIPTSDISHRASEQLERIKRLCALQERDIRSCYYHLGYTNRSAIFRISSVLPVTDEYISGEYTSQGIHLILRNTNLIAEIERKLSRILFDEERHHNKYEQRITALYTFMKTEIEKKAVLYEPEPSEATDQAEEIEEIVGKIEERGIKEMFAIENYDVQETRRIAKIEGKIEGKIEDAVNIIESLKITVSEAMRVLKLPKKEQKKIIKELEKRNIPYVVEQ